MKWVQERWHSGTWIKGDATIRSLGILWDSGRVTPTRWEELGHLGTGSGAWYEEAGGKMSVGDGGEEQQRTEFIANSWSLKLT